MAHTFLSRVVHTLLFLYPILELFAEPFDDIDSTLLKMYGSVHTMMDYINWSKTEDYIHPILQDKSSRLIRKKILIKRYLKWHNRIFHSILSKRPKALNYLRDHLAKHSYTVVRDAAHEVLGIGEKEWAYMWLGLPEMFISIHNLQMIQRTQQWSPHKVSQIFQSETTSKVQLTQKQAAEIGMCSLFRQMISFAVEWFEFSQQNYQNTNSDKAVPVDILKMMVTLSIQEHNKAGQKEECWNSYICHINLFTRPILKTTTKRIPVRQKAVLAANNQSIGPGEADPASQFVNLCSHPNQSIQHPNVLKTLKCFYEQNRHPSLYISPMKIEQLSISPNVYQIYDILGPKFIKELVANYKVNTSLPEILSGMYHYNGVQIENFETDPAKLIRNAKMYDNNKIFYGLTEAVSGLKFQGATESLQFLMYTPGRCFGAHEDVIRTNQVGVYKLIGGKRLACMLYYLEVPEMGGTTPFCQGGFRAHMTTGSAIIWFNKYRNGTDRDDVFHGSCPVVQGHKLILAQAIDYLPQFNHYKCSLNQFE